jgi:thiol-disulfide isomerase/thioredoxin
VLLSAFIDAFFGHQDSPMNGSHDTPRAYAKKRIALIVLGGVVGVAVGLAGVYGIGRLTGNAGTDPACTASVETARRMAPLIHGEVAAVSVANAPKSLPPLAFRDSSGAEKSLADWRGRSVLLNLWATWCVPCRKEMPALDALQGKLGGSDFEVVSINIDTRDTEKTKDWLRNVGINTLAYYADNSAKVFQDLKAAGKAFGMPTTLIVDRNGCELATLAGPAEWASEDALKLVTAALRK